MTAIAPHAPQYAKCTHRKYALTCDQFDEMLVRSGGRCEICTIPDVHTPHGALHIDHDEKRGMWAVRGLLCSRCNTNLDRPWMADWDAVRAYLADTWISRHPEAVRIQTGMRGSAIEMLGTLADEYVAVTAEVQRTRAVLHERIRAYQAAHGHVRGWQQRACELTGLTRKTIRQITQSELS